MAQPPKYTRVKNFADDFGHETDHSALNGELDKASNSINDIRANLAILQADDGRLRPDVVTYDSLDDQIVRDIFVAVRAEVDDELVRAEAAAVRAETEADRSEENANAAALSAREAAGSAAVASGFETEARQQAQTAVDAAQAANVSADQAFGSMTAAAGSAKSAAESAALSAMGTLVADAFGTADAIEVVFERPVTELNDYMAISVRTIYTNASTTPTLKVNGFGPLPIMKGNGKPLLAGDIAGQTCHFHYRQASGNWELQNPAKSLAIEVPPPFDSGTQMLFVQSAAPTGWTKVITHNDKALRVVSGAGGGAGGAVAFSAVFSIRTPSGSVGVSGTVGNTTLTVAQMPHHGHQAVLGDNFWSSNYITGAHNANGGVFTTGYTGGNGAHNHAFSGWGSFAGNAMDFRVQYVDAIIAKKD